MKRTKRNKKLTAKEKIQRKIDFQRKKIASLNKQKIILRRATLKYENQIVRLGKKIIYHSKLRNELREKLRKEK